MRLILLICAVCLLALAFGCKRSGQQSANNSTGPIAVSNDLAASRGQARELLEKGKELYRNDQDSEAVGFCASAGIVANRAAKAIGAAYRVSRVNFLNICTPCGETG